MDKKSLAYSAFLNLRENQWDQALDNYRQLRSQEPNDGRYAELLGDVLSQKGQLSEAMRAYKQASQLYLASGAEDHAATVYKKLLKLDPDSPEPKLEEGAPALDAATTQAIESLKRAVAEDPKNADHYQKLGDLLAKSGRKQEAAEQYFVIANALFNNRVFKKAEEIFQHILQLVPVHLQSHILLGEIYSKEGSDSDAKKELLFVAEELIRQGNLDRGALFAQKAIQLKSIEAHYYLGLVYFEKNQWDEARQEFDTLLKFKVNHQGGLLQLARINAQAGLLDEAQKLLERLLKIDPKSGEVQDLAGDFANQQSNTEAAKIYFSNALEAFAANEQWDRAAASAYKALKLDAKQHEMYLKLADAAYNAGLEAQSVDACNALADLFEAEGRSNEAARMRAKAQEILSPGSAPEVSAVAPPPPAAAPPAAPPRPAAAPTDELQVMLNIADAYIQQGSLDEAIEVYQKILKTDPNNEKVKTALTRVYAKFAGINPETAVRAKASAPAAPREASEAEKEDQRMQREARERALREAQLRAQRSSSPQEPAAASAAKSAPKEPELMQSAGDAREDEIGGDNQDEFMTVTVAEIYTKQGLLNEALKIYQKILEIEPGNLEAQVKKKELEAKLAEQEQLRQHSEKAAAEAAAAAAKAEPPKTARKPQEAAPESKSAPSDAASRPGNPPPDDPPPGGRGRKGRVSYV